MHLSAHLNVHRDGVVQCASKCIIQSANFLWQDGVPNKQLSCGTDLAIYTTQMWFISFQPNSNHHTVMPWPRVTVFFGVTDSGCIWTLYRIQFYPLANENRGGKLLNWCKKKKVNVERVELLYKLLHTCLFQEYVIQHGFLRTYVCVLI